MAGSAGGNHPADGGGGGGGGGPNGVGGNYGSGDYNGVTGSDGTDVYPANVSVTSNTGSYADGYVSISYDDVFGLLFDGGDITYDPAAPGSVPGTYGRITHIFWKPSVYTLTSTF
jgi:hypothetical protein